jgi:3-hydroxybutyrate dehydrogenase
LRLGIKDMKIEVTQRSIQAVRPLAGRVSLITSSTTGIGLGIARALADAGSDIVLNGFGKPDEVAETMDKVSADYGVHVTYSGADMSKPEAIRKAIETILGARNRLGVVVNNAALQEFPLENWDAIIAINLSSAFHTTRLALPAMNNWVKAL